MNPMSGGAQLQEHFLHSEFMVTAGILDDEVPPRNQNIAVFAI